MFEHDYKNAFDNIKPDDALKSKILDELQARETKKRNAAIPWRIGFAVAAAAAITLSVIFIPRGNAIKTDNSRPRTLSAAASYNEIYKIVSEYKTNIRIKSFLSKGEDEVLIEESIEYSADFDGAAVPGGGGATKGTASSNATANSAKQENTTTTVTDDAESADDTAYSETTTQVAGVKEADIVKTDGKYIYALYKNELRIFKADGKDTRLLSTTALPTDYNASYGEMFLNGNLLTVIQNSWYYESEMYSSIIIYDVTDPENPQKKYTCRQQGNYNSSRMIGNFVYIVTNSYINTENITRSKPETYVPTVICKGETTPVPADSIYRYDDSIEDARYTVIAAYDITTGEMTSSCSLLGGTDQIYCSTDNIITANAVYGADEPEETQASYSSVSTTVSRIAISNGNIEYKASGTIDGALENQFFIDEYSGNFRFVTTVDITTKSLTYFANSDREVVTYSSDSYACLTVLNSGLKEIGRLDKIAEGERVYSVRFMGDIAYFVTFRQTDPLFAADLSDPENPKILSALKIPGFSEYMYPYGDGLLLGFGRDADEKTGIAGDLKLSMFNIADPANVTEDDKTLIDGYTYSEALYNHKAMLVSPSKNLIGFTSMGEGKTYYMLYEYTGEGFAQKAKLALNTQKEYVSYETRGMFIGDYFYIVTENALHCYSLADFTQSALIKF